MSERPDPIAAAHQRWVEHGWGDVADGMAVVTSITRIQAIFQQRIDGLLRDLDLTFARYELLQLLSFSKEGRLPLASIGRRLQVHPTSVTSAVDRLVGQGFVVREPHPTDRRVTLAVLTEEGRRVAKDATQVLNEEVFAEVGLEGDDLTQLMGLLRRLRLAQGG